MRLLYDENLSPRLPARLAAAFPDSMHVSGAGLLGHSDTDLWQHARQHGFMLVSKDNDFRQMSFLHGAPPKVIWLQVGNAGTAPIAELLREQVRRLRHFEGEVESALLILSQVRRAV